MNIFGSLPASVSGKFKLDGVDFKKIVRFFAVVFIGAFCMHVSQTPLTSENVISVLEAAGKAGFEALVPALVEAVRRFLANGNAI